MADAPARYDVAVIGAGINGAGIARDAAMRGLSVIVLEKNDVCSGTSWASSRLVHGGLRYLEYGEIPLVYESLHERRYLRDIAAHLVKPIRICIPIYEGAKRGPLLIRLGMLTYDFLSLGKRLPRHQMLGRDAIRAEAPGLKPERLRAAACYYDAQVAFAERLVLENILAAKAAGATVKTYSPVVAVNIDGGSIESLSFHDADTGSTTEIQAKIVINAGGPWVDEVLGVTDSDVPRFVGGTKGSHIVVGNFDGAPADAFYVEAESDGRPFFVIPWNGQYLIGTTDIRYDGELSEVRASRMEVDYLLSETNRVFPRARLKPADIHYAYAGIRPLPHRDEGPESAITRKHIIKHHRQVADGLFSIIGGKLTTYRSLAEEAVDRCARPLGRKLPDCRTHDTPLPGAWGLEEAREALEQLDCVPAPGIDRLLSIYGGRAAAIADLARLKPLLQSRVGDQSEVIAAEVVFVSEEEMPRTLADVVFRRMMLGLDAEQGRSLYEPIANLVAQTLGWSEERTSSELSELRAYSDSLLVAC